jgi:hypothetical protein
MFRGTTARSAPAVLAAVLLVVQLFAPGVSFASAHTVRQAEASAVPSGTVATGGTPRDVTAVLRSCEHHGAPTGPLRLRDRHRAATCLPQPPERPPLRGDSAAPPPSAAPDPAHSSASRSPADRTPAALQIFRC